MTAPAGHRHIYKVEHRSGLPRLPLIVCVYCGKVFGR